jgi:hypothetical protein
MALPQDFPKWENVTYHYDIWAKPDEDEISSLDKIWGNWLKQDARK